MKHRLYLIDAKNRVTLPSKTLKELDASPGDYVYYEHDSKGVIIHKLKVGE